MSRAIGTIPLVGNGYPRDAYTPAEYSYLKRMDLQLNTLDVPSVNFLGATDDGTGHWINNSFLNLGYGDGIHPNDAGHLEMYLTIVPSVFEAVRQGKAPPRFSDRSKSLRILGDANQAAPLSLDAALMHSFAVSFRVRAAGLGTVAGITLPGNGGSPTVEINAGGIAYVGTNGVPVSSGVNGTNGAWHDITVAHQYARGLTFFYVDGLLVTNVAERMTPTNFVLGGRGNASNRPGSPSQADYQDWLVHRSLLNAEEVTAQYQGRFQQASLELYAPLNDPGLVINATVTNLAQSLTLVNLKAASSNLAPQTEMVPPANLNAVTNGTATINLNWNDPAAASEDGYTVERSTAGGAWLTLTNLAAHVTAYADTLVGPGTNYQYRVSYASGGARSSYAVSGLARLAAPGAVVTPLTDAILMDFGRHDGGVNGAVTPSPDAYGQYWNSMGPSTTAVAVNTLATNLVNVTNGPTTVAIKVLSTTFQCNGIQNGGLTTPDPAWLGSLAIATATEDYFFLNNGSAGVSGTLRIAGLNPAKKYKFSMFATRNTDASTIRTTKYSVTDSNGLHSVTLQTSGPGAGSAARPYGNDDTIPVLNGLVPDASGNLDLVVSEVAGLFAYLGLLEISQADDKPVFAVQPQSTAGVRGATKSLTAYAASSLPVNYQWFYNGQAISEATGTNWAIVNLNSNNIGNYYVVATNLLGGVTSAVVTVSLAPDHIPGSSVLIDFGRHDNGVNGDITVSPDANGNYWNNFGTSAGTVPQFAAATNLVTVNNTPVTLGVTVLSTTFQANGIQNGGLTTPDAALLGDFAIPTATEDYLFVNGTTAAGT
ncbi:MAG TPA: hypothetical protein VF607_09075, partial [Verrucomicrobiae bacterium]